MDPALEGIFDAPSTAQSSGAASSGGATSTNTAEFGIRDGRKFNDTNVEENCSTALLRDSMVAAPATSVSPTAERGRSRRPERSHRSTSIKVTTTQDTTLKSKLKSRLPKASTSPRSKPELTADERLDIATAEAKRKAGRAKTPERTMMAVEDNLQLLEPPDPLMQPYEANLEQVAPIQMTINAEGPAASIPPVSTNLEMVNDLVANLLPTTRPVPNGDDAEGYEASKRRKQECVVCNEAAWRMKHDHDMGASLEQRLRATDEQVALMKSRADKAKGRIVDYSNELARVNSHCDAQIAEMSIVLQTQRGQLNNTGTLNVRANAELADSKFELQRHAALTMSKERELQNARRRINEPITEGQLASDHHRATLDAAEQKLERACIQDGSGNVETAIELAEAHINLGRLQYELPEKIHEVALYNAELQQSKDLVLSTENDPDRPVIQYNRDQNEMVRLAEKVNQLEIKLKDNNPKVEGPDDGHFIVKRAHAEIQSAQNEARIANEELGTARRIFNQKVEQITAENTVTLDHNRTVINSLKSEVNRFTQNNAKLESRATVNTAPNNIDVPTQTQPAHRNRQDIKPLSVLLLGLSLFQQLADNAGNVHIILSSADSIQRKG